MLFRRSSVVSSTSWLSSASRRGVSVASSSLTSSSSSCAAVVCSAWHCSSKSKNDGAGKQQHQPVDFNISAAEQELFLEQERLLEQELARQQKASELGATEKEELAAYSEQKGTTVVDSATSEKMLQDKEDAAPKDDTAQDQAALHRYIRYALWMCVAIFNAFIANEYAKRRIGFKEKDSTYVAVNTRGRPALGGPFVLVNTEGDIVSQADFRGKYLFIYTGFVNCPEICPIELNRMTKVIDIVRAKNPEQGALIQPVFMSCDAKRDSLSRIKEYLSIFHKDFIGVVGTPKQIDAACKSYRIYYSLPDDANDDAGPASDFLIDHSIAIFFFDKAGKFVDFFGSRYDHNEIAEKLLQYMANLERDPEWTNY